MFRAQFRPQVSRWTNGTKPFITENIYDIGNAKSNLFYSVDFLAADNFTGGKFESTTDFAVSSFEVLPGLPEGITENPRTDFKGAK